MDDTFLQFKVQIENPFLFLQDFSKHKAFLLFMLIEFEKFENQCFPLAQQGDLFISKFGQIIKVKHYDLEYWRKWSSYIKEEIQVQIKMNKLAPNSFLKILNWTFKQGKDQMDIYILYESNQMCLNIENYVISEEKLESFICQILQIGCELQNNDVYHMNIKPNNFIVLNGQVKLTDFGSARFLNDYIFENKQAYYYCEQLMEIKQESNSIEKTKQLNLIDKVTCFRQNDNWGLGIIISQVILQDFRIKWTRFSPEEISKQIYTQKRFYRPLFVDLMIENKPIDQVLQRIISQLQLLKKSEKTNLLPFVHRLQPLNAENKAEGFDQLYTIPDYAASQTTLHSEKQTVSISSTSSDRPLFDDIQKTYNRQQNRANILQQEENIPSRTDRDQSVVSQMDVHQHQEIHKFQKIMDSFSTMDIKSKIIVQFYNSIFDSKLITEVNKNSELYTYESALESYNNSICQYYGYQQNSKPHGFGIQYRRKEKDRLLIGLFNRGLFAWGAQIEELDNVTVQLYVGDFNEKEIKNGFCELSWYSYDPGKGFTKMQSHTGEIIEGIINGQGKRTYYYSEKTIYQFNILYIGEFKQFQRHGKGKLFKLVNDEMLEIYDGQFENDKYSGSGKAVFEKDLIVEAVFEKGKTCEIKNILYKQEEMKQSKLRRFQ